jgi:hypothetical protein
MGPPEQPGTAADSVDDAAFRALESRALRRVVLGVELQFHHDLLADRAEVLRLGSPFAWAIEASVLRSISAGLDVTLASDRATGTSLGQSHALLSNESLLEELGNLGPLGVLTRHVCRATRDVLEVVQAEESDELGAYRAALESLSATVWPCASALDDRAWWVLRPRLGRCRRDVVVALRAGTAPSEVARLYREVWAHARM